MGDTARVRRRWGLIAAGIATLVLLLATIFASCKFILLAAAIAYLLAGLGMRLTDRGPTARTS